MARFGCGGAVSPVGSAEPWPSTRMMWRSGSSGVTSPAT
jgi:hypothetical protein